ncbi:MAG: restriction endonuclease [bacterium]|nr:restriction endonuclease [bacterium]
MNHLGNNLINIERIATDVLVILALGFLMYGLYRLAIKDWFRIKSWHKGRKVYKGHPVTLAMFEIMTPLDFELWVQGLFQEVGASATVKGQTGDHGIDVDVIYRGKSIVVQCKRWNKTIVNESIVRDLYGVKHYGGYDKAVLITTGKITGPAVKWAEGKGDISLIDARILNSIKLDPKRLIKYL